ncbi:MAG: ABC transporter ATP-binding protein [Rubrobacteraceae bacterium]
MRERLSRSQLVQTFSHVWPYMKPEWAMLLLAGAATLGLTVVELSVPIMIGMLLDSLLVELRGQPGAESGTLNHRVIIGLLAGAALLRGYFLYQQRSLAGQAGQRVTARMRSAVWSHLQRLPLEYTNRRGPGRLLVRFISDGKSVQRLVSRRLVQVVQDVLVVAGVLVALLFLNVRMGLAAILVLPLVALVFWRLNPKLQQASRATRRRRSRLSAYLGQRITGLSAIKAHGQHGREARRVEKLNRNIASRGARQEKAGGKLLGASAGVVALVTALALGLAVEEAAAGRLTAGSLVTFYALIGLLAPIFQRITITDRTFQEAEISIQRMADILAQEPESPEDENLPDLELDGGEVSFEGVSFEYPDGRRALDGVSFTARKGELVAIEGPSGAGKSTLLELVPLFRKPAEGSIKIDGQDVTKVSLESLRARIGVVTPHTTLFDATVFENVSYGARDEDEEERIRSVARLAGVDEIVASLPDGWDTKLREGKRGLSQGQRLRVLLARALAADPSILLLDDVDSVLDEETLRILSRQMTVIVTTNDASTIPADRVYELEDGQLAGDSSPELACA